MIQSYPRAHCIDSMSRLIVLSGRRSILRLPVRPPLAHTWVGWATDQSLLTAPQRAG